MFIRSIFLSLLFAVPCSAQPTGIEYIYHDNDYDPNFAVDLGDFNTVIFGWGLGYGLTELNFVLDNWNQPIGTIIRQETYNGESFNVHYASMYGDVFPDGRITLEEDGVDAMQLYTDEQFRIVFTLLLPEWSAAHDVDGDGYFGEADAWYLATVYLPDKFGQTNSEGWEIVLGIWNGSSFEVPMWLMPLSMEHHVPEPTTWVMLWVLLTSYCFLTPDWRKTRDKEDEQLISKLLEDFDDLEGE